MLVSSCEGAQGCETSRGPRYPMPHKGAGRNPKQTDRVLLLLFLRRRSTHSMALVSWEASGGKLKCVRMCVCVCVVRSRKEGADEGGEVGGWVEGERVEPLELRGGRPTHPQPAPVVCLAWHSGRVRGRTPVSRTSIHVPIRVPMSLPGLGWAGCPAHGATCPAAEKKQIGEGGVGSAATVEIREAQSSVPC
jgi:hypothetical protein